MHKNIAHSWYSNPFSLGVGVGGFEHNASHAHIHASLFGLENIFKKKRKGSYDAARCV